MARLLVNCAYASALDVGTLPCHILTIMLTPFHSLRWRRQVIKKARAGMPQDSRTLLNRAALPQTNLRPDFILRPGHCASLVSHVAVRFSAPSNRVFLNSAAPCACFGREKEARDGLQRHPLIDPIFPFPFTS